MANLDPAVLAQFKARNAGGSGGTNYTGTSWIDTPEWRYEPVYQNDGGPEGGSTSLIGYNQFKQGVDASQPGAEYAMYNPDGTFGRYGATKDPGNGMDLLATGIIAALTMGMGIPAMMAAGGAGAGGAGAGAMANGAFLGEGVASGIGAWDGAMAAAAGGAGSAGSAAGFLGEGASSGIPAWDGAGLAGGMENGAFLGEGAWTPTSGGGAMPGGFGSAGGGSGGGLWDTIKSGASSLGGSGGSLGGYGQYIGPLASLYGAKKGADAAKDAAGAQIQSTREANALAAAMFDKQVALQEPFRQGGMAGMNKLLSGLGLGGDPNAAGYGSFAKDFSMADYEADPGYAFRQSEGQKAVERSAAARGNLLSGRAAKDMTRFAQGEASQEYGNAFNRFQINRAAKINPLQSLMGAGQSSANTLTSAAGNYGQQAGQNIIGAGNAAAAGKVGSANAISNGIGSAWNMYQSNQLMNKFFPNGA